MYGLIARRLCQPPLRRRAAGALVSSRNFSSFGSTLLTSQRQQHSNSSSARTSAGGVSVSSSGGGADASVTSGQTGQRQGQQRQQQPQRQHRHNYNSRYHSNNNNNSSSSSGQDAGGGGNRNYHGNGGNGGGGGGSQQQRQRHSYSRNSQQQQYRDHHHHHHQNDRSSNSGAGESSEKSSHARQQQQQSRPAVDMTALPAEPLATVHFLAAREAAAETVQWLEGRLASAESLLAAAGGPCAVRDVMLGAARACVALGRMDVVRSLFGRAVRELGPAGLLSAAFFDAYLEVLTLRRSHDPAEAVMVLEAMAAARVPRTRLTYHYLIEMHIRAGAAPQGLWREMAAAGLRPLPATLRALLTRVVPRSTDAPFVLSVARAALRAGSAAIDRRQLSELVQQVLSERPPSAGAAAEGAGAALVGSGPAGAWLYAPEHVMWLLHELELRCVAERAALAPFVQVQHVAALLLRCAKAADATTAGRALALMERHVMRQTADVMALSAFVYAQAREVERALDAVAAMARRGHLDNTDPFKKYTIDCLRLTLDRHFLLCVADALGNGPALARAARHLARQRRSGAAVSAHVLDLLVLAAARQGEERRALALVAAYPTVWGVAPRANTYNCLLVGCAAHQHGAMLLRAVYDDMRRAGIAPTPVTFRLLIRQAVASDDVDEAAFYLQEAARQPGLRVEVEMVLPILERAARAGDAETATRLSRFALDSDIGIDPHVMQTVMRHLSEAGQDVTVLQGHLPLHEALRSRSKVGRQRARSEITL